MNKDRLFKFLGEQDAATLLNLLSDAYDFLSRDDREDVFGRSVTKLPPATVDGATLLADIESFAKSSRAGYYYEPFEINSKNWTDVPEETEEWFEKMGDYLQDSSRLTEQGDFIHAVTCFSILYELIDLLNDGEEIVFGDEIGSWMIPADEKQYNQAYLTALAATATPEEFAAAVVPLTRQDSRESFYGKVYATAIIVANSAQRKHLDTEIQRLNIRTRPGQ